MPAILRRICALREAVGPDVPIYISKMDVKDAFRRLHVAWEKAPTFAYMANDLIVVDFRLPFRLAQFAGVVGSPRFGGTARIL